VALVTVVAGFVAIGGRALGGSEPVAGAERYRVQAGDTLWAIARREVGPEGDPRPLVADIREANGLGTGILAPGQVLVLPAG
jgi:LysM repeat protein